MSYFPSKDSQSDLLKFAFTTIKTLEEKMESINTELASSKVEKENFIKTIEGIQSNNELQKTEIINIKKLIDDNSKKHQVLILLFDSKNIKNTKIV